MTITQNLTCDPDEVVGVSDIAANVRAAGKPCETATVNSWRKRASTAKTRIPMPDPDGFISERTPWWFWTATMLPWLVATNRL